MLSGALSRALSPSGAAACSMHAEHAPRAPTHTLRPRNHAAPWGRGGGATPVLWRCSRGYSLVAHGLKPRAPNQGPGQLPPNQKHSGGPEDALTAAELDEKAIREMVNNAANILDSMIDEVCYEMFASEAVAEITNTEGELKLERAIQTCVKKRIEELDQSFLMAADEYIRAAAVQGKNDIVGVLQLIRQEILDQVSQRLPPALQTINEVIGIDDQRERVAFLLAATKGEAPNIPATGFVDLALTSNQIIEEMEELDEVPDRKLLARLCVVREELKDLELQEGWGMVDEAEREAVSWYRSTVPKRTMAFINELIRVNDAPQRAQLLYRAFAEDWQGGEAAAKRREQAAAAGRNLDGSDNLDIVRPGRFLSALMATTTELSNSTETSQALLNRLRSIKEEAIQVLDEISKRGVPAPAPRA